MYQSPFLSVLWIGAIEGEVTSQSIRSLPDCSNMLTLEFLSKIGVRVRVRCWRFSCLRGELDFVTKLPKGILNLKRTYMLTVLLFLSKVLVILY